MAKRKNKVIVGMIAIVLIAVLLVSIFQMTGIFQLFGDNYGTGLSADTSSNFGEHEKPYPYDSGWEGRLFLKGNQGTSGNEIFTEPKYVVAWQGSSELSQQISVRTDFLYHARFRCEGLCVFGYIVGSLLGRYWMVIDYTSTDGTVTNIVNTKNNYYNTNYIRVTRGLVSDFKNGEGHQLPNADYITEDYNGLGNKQWHTAWTESDGGAQWYQKSTGTLEFKMKGAQYGKLSIKTWIRAAHRENRGWADWYFHQGDYLIAQDECYLASGEGEVIITSSNAVSSDGTAVTDETNVVYTKYVYEEGSTVQMQVDAGYSGTSVPADDPDNGDGWRLSIYNSQGLQQYTRTIPDNVRGYPVSYTLPAGSFVPNDPNDNQWRVVLSNTMFDQSETRFFSIDRFEYIPGQTTILTDKTRYTQFETVTVTLQAYANELTGKPIDHFTAWAKYTSPSSTDYAKTLQNYPAQFVSGRLYRASFTFTVAKGDRNVYIRAHAIDSEGRAGAEGENTIFVQQATGNYQVTVTVRDATSSKPLKGATARMGNSIATTDASGIANLYVNLGTHQLLVTSPGYNDYSLSSILVQSDTNIPVSLVKSGGLQFDMITIIAILSVAFIIIAIIYYLYRTGRLKGLENLFKRKKKNGK